MPSGVMCSASFFVYSYLLASFVWSLRKDRLDVLPNIGLEEIKTFFIHSHDV